MRNWARNAVSGIQDAGAKASLLRLEGNERWAAFAPRNLARLAAARPGVLLYVPYSGFTTASMLRFAVLRLCSFAPRSAIVGLQAHPDIRALPLLRPPLALVASDRLAHRIRHAVGRRVVVPPVVDCERFAPVREARCALKTELEAEEDRPL